MGSRIENVKDEYWADNGLQTFDSSSIIHLLFPLTKESVSTNNGGGGNYNSNGTIKTIKTWDTRVYTKEESI